jgi:hypothetical protein
MRDSRTLGPWLRRFLADYIVTERHLAFNTQKSYRDSFKLLLPFISIKVRKPVDRLDVEDLTPPRVLRFLAHLEEERDCSVQTRNQRLTAIRSFARFVASRDPSHLAWCGQIRGITSKTAAPQPISWMTKDEMEALLAVPDRHTKQGRIEHALLLFLYNTGARISGTAANDRRACSPPPGRRAPRSAARRRSVAPGPAAGPPGDVSPAHAPHGVRGAANEAAGSFAEACQRVAQEARKPGVELVLLRRPRRPGLLPA